MVAVVVVMTREEGGLTGRDSDFVEEEAEVEEGQEVAGRRGFGRTSGVGSECLEQALPTGALARRRRVSFKSYWVRGRRGPAGLALA